MLAVVAACPLACFDAATGDLTSLCETILNEGGEPSGRCRAQGLELPQAQLLLDGRMVALGAEPVGDDGAYIYVAGVDHEGQVLDAPRVAAATELESEDGTPLPLISVAPGTEWAAPELLAMTILVDFSQSMRDADVERASGVIEELTGGLPQGLGTVEVAVFSDEDQVVQGATADRELASRALASASISRGKTALLDAVGDAALRFDDREAPMRVLVVITDGFDNASTRWGLGAVINALRERRIVLIPIALFLADPQVLSKLAGELGISLYAPDFDGLSGAVGVLSRALGAVARAELGGLSAGARRVLVMLDGMSAEAWVPGPE